MAQRPQLSVQKRKTLGRKVKKLREKGILPANVYGKKIKSAAVQVAYKDFGPVYRAAGETTIVDILLDKAKTPQHTLIRDVQLDPVTNKVLHVDLMQVDLKEKIEADVPVKIEGKSPAVRDKQALLLQELSEVTVEAPADKLPEKISVDAGSLQEVGAVVHVADLKVPAGVEIKTEKEQVVVRLADLVTKEAEELEKKEEEAAEEAAAEGAEKPEEEKEEKKEEEEKEKEEKEEKSEEKKEK